MTTPPTTPDGEKLLDAYELDPEKKIRHLPTFGQNTPPIPQSIDDLLAYFDRKNPSDRLYAFWYGTYREKFDQEILHRFALYSAAELESRLFDEIGPCLEPGLKQIFDYQKKRLRSDHPKTSDRRFQDGVIIPFPIANPLLFQLKQYGKVTARSISGIPVLIIDRSILEGAEEEFDGLCKPDLGIIIYGTPGEEPPEHYLENLKHELVHMLFSCLDFNAELEEPNEKKAKALVSFIDEVLAYGIRKNQKLEDFIENGDCICRNFLYLEASDDLYAEAIDPAHAWAELLRNMTTSRLNRLKMYVLSHLKTWADFINITQAKNYLQETATATSSYPPE